MLLQTSVTNAETTAQKMRDENTMTTVDTLPIRNDSSIFVCIREGFDETLDLVEWWWNEGIVFFDCRAKSLH